MASTVMEVPAAIVQVSWSCDDIKALSIIARRRFGERTELRCLHAKRLHDLLAGFNEQIRLHPGWMPWQWAEASVAEISATHAPGYRRASRIFLCDMDVALREFYDDNGVDPARIIDGFLQESPA